ncbi:sun domain-containing protein 1-like [Odontomachus brunneus]|uniref:sun domain-containing protein 1-like n=1 Tax=Odontomachus brunneus TaxID=486640 RepID=UPI0013F207B4|nr:sun domain-containing protein 1-like [Odontomachus brunneus]
MEIKQHYELRNRRMKTKQHHYELRNRTRKNSKIHEENMKAIEKNKKKSMTGSVTNNQNTKTNRQIFINGLNENKENGSNYKVEQKYKGIVPCRILLSNCLSKEGERKNSWSKPKSVHKTYEQGEPLNVYSNINQIYLQASRYPYEAVSYVLAMSKTLRQFVHNVDSGNSRYEFVSYEGQISRRTTVVSKEIAPHFHLDISRVHAVNSAGKSALNESMHERFKHANSAHMYSKRSLNFRVRKWLREKIWMWILLPFLLSLFMLGSWHIMRYLLFFPAVHDTSENMTDEFLSALKVDSNESREAEEKLIDSSTLASKIIIFEREQTYLKEYLINISCILEDYKRRQVDFEKEHNEKNIIMSNKLNISEISVLNNELKVIKHEFEKLRNLSVELTFFVNNYTKTQVDKILSDYFPPKISKENLTENMLTSRKDRAVSNDNANDSDAHMSEEHVRKIVKEILQIYDADKTGRVDYALESAGGEIISTRNTREYNVKSRAFTIFGFPLYYQSYDNNPRTVIQKNAIQPGACWAFQNFPGYLLIRLRSTIYVTGFTLEHVPRSIVPAGYMSSAPRNFNVWGLTYENDLKPVMFGDYEFVHSGDNLQYFPIQNTEIKKPYEYIELRIHSNHGQLDYTCLYKFRAHGRPT